MPAGLGKRILVGILVVLAVWLYTPLPTLAARYAWSEWRAGALALALDRSDAPLAATIGAYYFGNQFATDASEERPYDLSLARNAFGKAIEINPSMPFTRYLRARVEFVQSDFDAALED